MRLNELVRHDVGIDNVMISLNTAPHLEGPSKT